MFGDIGEIIKLLPEIKSTMKEMVTLLREVKELLQDQNDFLVEMEKRRLKEKSDQFQGPG